MKRALLVFTILAAQLLAGCAVNLDRVMARFGDPAEAVTLDVQSWHVEDQACGGMLRFEAEACYVVEVHVANRGIDGLDVGWGAWRVSFADGSQVASDDADGPETLAPGASANVTVYVTSAPDRVPRNIQLVNEGLEETRVLASANTPPIENPNSDASGPGSIRDDNGPVAFYYHGSEEFDEGCRAGAHPGDTFYACSRIEIGFENKLDQELELVADDFTASIGGRRQPFEYYSAFNDDHTMEPNTYQRFWLSITHEPSQAVESMQYEGAGESVSIVDTGIFPDIETRDAWVRRIDSAASTIDVDLQAGKYGVSTHPVTWRLFFANGTWLEPISSTGPRYVQSSQVGYMTLTWDDWAEPPTRLDFGVYSGWPDDKWRTELRLPLQ